MKRPQRLCPWGCGKLVAFDTSRRRYWHKDLNGAQCLGGRQLVNTVSAERMRSGFICVCDQCADQQFFKYAPGGVATDDYEAWVGVHFHHPKRSSSLSYESSES